MENKAFKRLAVLIPILNLLDSLTTLIGLNYANVKELNPFFELIFNFNFFALKLFSAIFLSVLLIITWNFASKNKTSKIKRFVYVLAVSINILYIAVIINNLAVLFFAC